VIDPSGKTTIDFFVPSLDGSKVAVSMSKAGSENGTVYVFDSRNGERLPDEVPRVNGGTAGGGVAWNAAGTGFWRTRYPSPGERPDGDLAFYQQVSFHRLGTPAAEDVYVVGKEFPRIAEIQLVSSEDGRYVLIDVSNGDGGEHAFWLAASDGVFHRLSTFEDLAVRAEFGTDALYLLSRKDAPNGKILRLPLKTALADGAFARATTLVPQSGTAIVGMVAGDSRLYLQEIVGGPSQLRIVNAVSGRLRGQVPIPPIASIGGLVRTTGNELLIQTQSFTEPGRWWRLDPMRGDLVPTALRLRSPADYSDTEVRREFAISKDGTRVPINILMRKGTRLDGSSPCLLTGYGGYGISQTPSFSPSRRVWIEQGGIYVIANIRGGGEYGDAWHRAGNLTRKQNVFDDFAACAQYLIDHQYTTRERLAIQGGSNGGLLMGAMITQHPELFRAVVSSVGLYDMLRVELTPNGEFNVTEFGTVKVPEQFKALYAYSPYHHVVEGTSYPATLMLTGANDPRVDPWQSRKMIARLQAASSSQAPILLRTSGDTGHGGGMPRNARNEQLADIYAFLFKVLGLSYRQPTAGTLP
jgi:prolyl oligopeptidase